mmetsp:Transcript_15710/g.7558  ORF Transcript_15710/g.7558 Transcript_15710/m.7558 type:complete len:240 (+) Transcript_15710:169-888(+)
MYYKNLQICIFNSKNRYKFPSIKDLVTFSSRGNKKLRQFIAKTLANLLILFDKCLQCLRKILKLCTAASLFLNSYTSCALAKVALLQESFPKTSFHNANNPVILGLHHETPIETKPFNIFQPHSFLTISYSFLIVGILSTTSSENWYCPVISCLAVLKALVVRSEGTPAWNLLIANKTLLSASELVYNAIVTDPNMSSSLNSELVSAASSACATVVVLNNWLSSPVNSLGTHSQSTWRV